MCQLIFSQPFPQEFFNYKIQKLLFDSGDNWSSISSFGPLRYQQMIKKNNKNQDSLYVNFRPGVLAQNNLVTVYGYSHFIYQKHFYGYLYSRIINDSSISSHHSGLPQEINRLNFNSGETDLSGIGFQNEWVTLQVCHGRESWAAGNDVQLCLSELSPTYDYFMIGSDYGKIRVRYIHGFLEKTESKINRYITARGIEWTNNKSVVIGLSEVAIYSGPNRFFDISYLNPVSAHLEIEWNERANQLGEGMGNAVWQASIDLFIREKLRLSGNYLIDDFTFDDIQKKHGKEHGAAYSYRLAFVPVKSEKYLISLSSYLIHVGTPTFRHHNGTNNFVQRGYPLGWKYGSDGSQLGGALNIYNQSNLLVSFELNKLEIGQESTIDRVYEPYEDYLKGKFPSGKVEEIIEIKTSIEWFLKTNIMFQVEQQFELYNRDYGVLIGLNIFFPFKTII